MKGLITANVKVLGTYPNDNDKLIIAKRGFMTSESTSFSSLDGTGSNIHVVGLADLTSLYNYSSAIVENEWNCSSGVYSALFYVILQLAAAWLQFDL